VHPSILGSILPVDVKLHCWMSFCLSICPSVHHRAYMEEEKGSIFEMFHFGTNQQLKAELELHIFTLLCLYVLACCEMLRRIYAITNYFIRAEAESYSKLVQRLLYPFLYAFSFSCLIKRLIINHIIDHESEKSYGPTRTGHNFRQKTLIDPYLSQYT
jgi:hypothetical protein